MVVLCKSNGGHIAMFTSFRRPHGGKEPVDSKAYKDQSTRQGSKYPLFDVSGPKNPYLDLLVQTGALKPICLKDHGSE